MEKNFRHGSIQKMKLSDGSDGFGGDLNIDRLIKTKIRLRLNTDKRSESSPDYFVETPDYDEQERAPYWAESGAAWLKTPKGGGDDFLSISVDMADQPTVIYVAAFKADEEDQPKKGEGGELWRMAYTRPRPKSGRARDKDDARGPVLNDEIVY